MVCGFNGNGDLSRINVWGARGLVGRQSGTNAGTAVYDYLWDNRGNISQSVSSLGGVDSTYRVTAWGEVTSDGGTYDPYRCMGGEFGNYFDQETGLVLCGQRYYDPQGGRWLTRDPIEYDGGLNLYGYVENNPVNLTDPDGELPWVIGGAIAARRAYAFYKAYRVARRANDLARAERLLRMARRAKAIARAQQARARQQAANKAAQARKLAEKAKPASEKTARDMAKRIERDLGKDARREFHDAKDRGAGDRTLEQLKQDACDLYRDAGKEIPSWLK